MVLEKQNDSVGKGVKVKISSTAKCVAALQKIAMLADTGSEVYKQRFDGTVLADNGWAVAEAMREVANDCIGSLPLEEDLTITELLEACELFVSAESHSEMNVAFNAAKAAIEKHTAARRALHWFVIGSYWSVT